MTEPRIAGKVNIEVGIPEIIRQNDENVLSGYMPSIHFDVLRFFGVNFDEINQGDTLEQLKSIEQWAFKDKSTLGDALGKMRDLEIQLGTPHNNETKYNRMYNWIKMEEHINDIRGRQKSL